MSLSIRELGENIKNSHFFAGTVLYDEELKLHTTIKIGGKAKIFVEPETVEAAVYVLSLCKANNINVFFIGGGSNLVFSDEGFEGLILSTRLFNSIEYKALDKNHVEITCGSGVLINDVIEYCQSKGFKTLDTFYGLPGSCGGAVYMNARCYGKDTSDFLSGVEYILFDDITEINEIDEKSYLNVESIKKMYHNNRSDWMYKHSPFMNKKCLITKVSCYAESLYPELLQNDSAEVPVENINSLKSENDFYMEDRTKKGHFKFPSAGSVFKNNHAFGAPSGKLIDQCGLKGLQIGGAQIAPFHGNFIINTGNATSSDVKTLVQRAKDAVKEKFGFDLECEIIFV